MDLQNKIQTSLAKIEKIVQQNEKNANSDIFPIYAISEKNCCPWVQYHEKFLRRCHVMGGPKKFSKKYMGPF